MTQFFYHTPFSQGLEAQLQQQNFNIYAPYAYPEGTNLFLVLCKPERRYTIVNESDLLDQQELAETMHNQNILPITLNEIQSWEN